MVPVLSMYTMIGNDNRIWSLVMKDLSQSPSCMTWVTAMYSASVEERVCIVCFFDTCAISPSGQNQAYPEMESLSSTELVQSVSQYA